MNRRPHGHSFKAIEVIQNAMKKEDKYLVYDFNDGSDGNVPFLIKSSKRKVEVLNKLNMNGVHRLSSETFHLDVLHNMYYLFFFYLHQMNTLKKEI